MFTYFTTVVYRSLLCSACSPNPCQNGGTCSDADEPYGTPECVCEDGFSGDICETGKISYDMRVEQFTKYFYYLILPTYCSLVSLRVQCKWSGWNW